MRGVVVAVAAIIAALDILHAVDQFGDPGIWDYVFDTIDHWQTMIGAIVGGGAAIIAGLFAIRAARIPLEENVRSRALEDDRRQSDRIAMMANIASSFVEALIAARNTAPPAVGPVSGWIGLLDMEFRQQIETCLELAADMSTLSAQDPDVDIWARTVLQRSKEMLRRIRLQIDQIVDNARIARTRENLAGDIALQISAISNQIYMLLDMTSQHVGTISSRNDHDTMANVHLVDAIVEEVQSIIDDANIREMRFTVPASPNSGDSHGAAT